MRDLSITNLTAGMNAISSAIHQIDTTGELATLGTLIRDRLYDQGIKLNHKIAGVNANKYTSGFFGELLVAADLKNRGATTAHLRSRRDRLGNINFLESNDVATRNASITYANNAGRLYVHIDRLESQGNSDILTMINRTDWSIWSAPRVVWQTAVATLPVWRRAYYVPVSVFEAAGGEIVQLCSALRDPLLLIE